MYCWTDWLGIGISGWFTCVHVQLMCAHISQHSRTPKCQLLLVREKKQENQYTTTKPLRLRVNTYCYRTCDTCTDQWLTSQLTAEQLGFYRRDEIATYITVT